MNNIELVKIGNTADDVLEEFAGLFLLQTIFLNNVIKQLTLLNILHHQKEMLGRFDYLSPG